MGCCGSSGQCTCQGCGQVFANPNFLRQHMRRCPASMGPRPMPGTVRPAAPVKAENTKYVPGQPFTRPMGIPAKPTTVMAMQPAQAMQMSSKLERIFFGLAWTNAAGGQTVDIDASVISFSKGQQVDCVSWKKLGNSSRTLKHTGDIMHGANTKGEDMERIYMWLANMDASIDSLVMTANVYTEGLDFSALSSAYVRVANADTNQELGRMWLGGEGFQKMSAGNNAIVFAKAYRYGGHWQVMMLGQPLSVPGCTVASDMVPAITGQGVAYPPPPPAASGNPGFAPPGVKQQRPSRVLPCMALAAGSAVGIAAAVAIFNSDDMSPDMFHMNNFTDGVDFDMQEVSSFIDGIDLAESWADLGDWAGDAMDAVGEAAGAAAEWSQEAATDAWGAVNDSGVLEATADFAGDMTDQVAEFAEGVDFEGAMQDVGDWGGDAMDAAGGALAGIDFGGAADAVGGFFGGGDGGDGGGGFFGGDGGGDGGGGGDGDGGGGGD